MSWPLGRPRPPRPPRAPRPLRLLNLAQLRRFIRQEQERNPDGTYSRVSSEFFDYLEKRIQSEVLYALRTRVYAERSTLRPPNYKPKERESRHGLQSKQVGENPFMPEV